MTKARNTNQSRAYAARRASQAVDEVVTAASATDKAQTQMWADWGTLADYAQAWPVGDR